MISQGEIVYIIKYQLPLYHDKCLFRPGDRLQHVCLMIMSYNCFIENLGAPWSSGAWGPGPNGPVVDPPLLLRLERTMNLLEGGKGGEGRMGERGWGGEGTEGGWGERVGRGRGGEREGGEREGGGERGRVGREERVGREGG